MQLSVKAGVAAAEMVSVDGCGMGDAAAGSSDADRVSTLP